MSANPAIMSGFRPLDGESFSKPRVMRDQIGRYSFRPLDGESFSKPRVTRDQIGRYSFRPLDGESFSKQCENSGNCPVQKLFPSPRRGIIF